MEREPVFETTVRRIGLGSVFRVAFMFYGILGLLLAFVYGFFFLIFSQLLPSLPGPGSGLFGSGLRVSGVFVFLLAVPAVVAYAAFAAGLVTLGAAVYNLLASWTGGIRITLRQEPVAPVSGWTSAPPFPASPPSGPPPGPDHPPEPEGPPPGPVS